MTAKQYALGGADLKIIWAHHHLDELKRHVGLYLSSEPHRVLGEQDGDVVRVGKPFIYVPPHLDIGREIGNCLYAMMSALDYIVWELANKHATIPVTPPPLGTDTLSFPLYSDRERFLAFWEQTTTKRWAKYQIPASALDEIKAVQPYNAGYESLALLYFLVNEDKHRLPVLFVGHVESSDITVTYAGEAMSVVESTATDVTVKAPGEPPAVYDARQMRVHSDLTMYVSFAYPMMPREPAEVTLNNILKCVEGVVARFSKFFF